MAIIPAPNDVGHRLLQAESAEAEINDELRELQSKVRSAYERREHQASIKKALESFQKATPSASPPAPPPSDQRRKKFQPISPQIRALIVENVLYKGSMSWEKAAATYGVSRPSVARILKEERKRKMSENPEPPKMPRKRGRKTPLNADILVFLLCKVEADSTLTYRDLLQLAESSFHIETSESAICHALEKLDVTWKNIMPIPTEWNTPEVIRARTEFLGNVLMRFEAVQRPIVYADETGFNLHTRKSKGHAPRGKPATISVVPKGQRITLIAALSVNGGMVHHRIVNNMSGRTEKRGTTALDFRNFVLDLGPKVAKGSVLVLDNAKIHHAKELEGTWDILKQVYGIDVAFLPPYSPFLNPIEYAFNDLKMGVCASEFFNRGELIDVIQRQIPTITPFKTQGYFSHSRKYHPQALLGLPFYGKPLNPDFEQSSDTPISHSQSSLPPA